MFRDSLETVPCSTTPEKSDSEIDPKLIEAASLTPEIVDLHSQLQTDFDQFSTLCKSLNEDIPLLKIQFLASGNDSDAAKVKQSKSTETGDLNSKFEANEEELGKLTKVKNYLQREKDKLETYLKKAEMQRMLKGGEVDGQGSKFTKFAFLDSPDPDFVSPFLEVDDSGQILKLNTLLTNQYDPRNSLKTKVFEFDSIFSQHNELQHANFVKNQIEILENNLDYLCVMYGHKRVNKTPIAENLIENLFDTLKGKPSSELRS